MENFFWQGLVIGFSIAAPVGPIGILCVRRTLTGGGWSGFLSGLGAASADAVYGAVAGFGLTAVSTLMLEWQSGLRMGGGLFLCWLAVAAYRTPAAEKGTADASGGRLSDFVSTFFLTLSNPMTILSFLAVFAGLGLGGTGDRSSAVRLVSGVFVGSAVWWLMLSAGVHAFRSRLDLTALRWVNRISGAILALFGIAAVLSVF